jgi:hypothetical protein
MAVAASILGPHFNILLVASSCFSHPFLENPSPLGLSATNNLHILHDFGQKGSRGSMGWDGKWVGGKENDELSAMVLTYGQR